MSATDKLAPPFVDEPLFDLAVVATRADDSPERSRPKRQTAPRTPVVAKWASYTAKTRCHVCSANWQAGSTEPVEFAKWKRTTPEGFTLFCYSHATPVRDMDDEVARKEAARAHFQGSH